MAQRGKPRWSFLPVSTLPRPLNIAWCWFPLDEQPGTPGPKHRPTLFRALKLSPDGKMAAVEVTFGTSNAKFDSRPFDLIIQNSSSLDCAGLPQVTRFDLDITIWLPWASEFFTPREGYTSPITGYLDEASRMQLEALKVARRIHPERS